MLLGLSVLTGLTCPSIARAVPIGWSTDYGQPLGYLTGQDDAQQSASFGFSFPFGGAAYSTAWISTNGYLNLGTPANNPSSAGPADLLQSSTPVIAPFYADFDLLDQGTVYFNSQGSSALITWDHVGSYASPTSPFTFQVQLDANGQMTFRFNGLSSASDLDSPLLVGFSPGKGASDPGSRNLLLPFTSNSTTVYQAFGDAASYDLDNRTIVFSPTANGYSVSLAATAVPEPSSLLLLVAGGLAVILFRFRSRKIWKSALVVIGCLGLSHSGQAQNPRPVGSQGDGTYVVPTGQLLQPVGQQIEVNDRPLGMVVSPDGNTLAVVTGSNFNPRALHIVDLQTNTLRQSISIGDSFVGVDFTKDGNTLYVGGGTGNNVLVFTKNNAGQFLANGTIAIAGSAPSGLRLSPDNSRLYVALNQKNAVAVIDTQSRAVLTQIPVGTYPYTTAVSKDGSKVYVSNWGGRIPGPGDTTDGTFPVVVDPRTGIPISGTVSVISAASNQVIKTITVDRHPCGMALSPSGDRLYVTNANSDTVSVIDTNTDEVVKSLLVNLTSTKVGQTKTPVLGSSPNAVTVSPDGATIYVANASDNAISVLDPNSPTSNPVLGLIPTGWYPTAVATSASGKNLIVANGYGFGSIAPIASGTGRSYADRKGEISILPIPDPVQLGNYTRQVRQSNSVLPVGAAVTAANGNPIPIVRGGQTPIKHVFYIIKENRTYDQVFGDMAQGNGDASLVQFGQNVTPNLHALANQFVLMDNYYGPGDQSALGHRWCLQAYAGDWIHKYSNGRNDQNPMLLGATEAIYDNAKANGLSVHSFGERGLNTFSNPNATWTDVYNDWKNQTNNVQISPYAEIIGLRDIYDSRFPAYELRVPDQYRANIFLQQFAQWEQNRTLPSLVIILLPQDHTNGTSPGYPTPRAMNADNDLAVGKVVDAISHSQDWGSSAIFITEDDSQDGTDHVDGHRTVGMVISPWVRHNAVDSNMYTIINMYKTIEQILGLAPLNQFDLAAAPMFSLFSGTPDMTPYAALPNQIALDEMNPALAGLTGLQRELAEASAKNNTSEADSGPADVMNRAIWHSVKGYNTPYKLGRKEQRGHDSFLDFLKLAGS